MTPSGTAHTEQPTRHRIHGTDGGSPTIPPPVTPEEPHGPHRWRRLAFRVALVGLGLFALMQAVPYGRSHTNPPTLAEPQWNSPVTRALAVRACFDCHSNLTAWPWYTNIAPVSWLVQSDVSGGRSSLNFSEWARPQDGAGDAASVVASGSMPPWFYVIIHPNAKLSTIEKQQLSSGLAATFLKSPPIGGG